MKEITPVQQFKSFRRLVGRHKLAESVRRSAPSEIFPARAASSDLPIFLEKIGSQLEQCQAPHTNAFFDEVKDHCRSWFIYGKRYMTDTDKLIMTDPYGVGGFFNPILGKSIEQLTYAKKNSWFEVQQLLNRATAASRLAFFRGLSDLGKPINEDQEAQFKVQLEKIENEPINQSEKAFLQRWREEFLSTFGYNIG